LNILFGSVIRRYTSLHL